MSWQAGVSKLDSTRLCFVLLYAAEHFFMMTLHGPHRKHSLLWSHIVLGVFTAPLHSNGHGVDHIENSLSIVETFLLSRCLAMGLRVTIYIYILTRIKIKSALNLESPMFNKEMHV
jgi:hypothetical protein